MKKQKFLRPLFSLLFLLGFLLLPAQTGRVRAATNSEPFTATVGLDRFSSYRMNLSGEFDGTRGGRPSSGSFAGFFDLTKNPKAQHLRLELEGETFSSLAPLGRMEVYEVNNTVYLQNPRNGSWLTLPAFLVNTMLPNGVPTPEEDIDLPLTAVPQPGREIVNGIITQRYTFSSADLADDVKTKYDNVEGTIWVAVDGNYVVRYEATVSGQFDHLKTSGRQFGSLIGGDLTFPDEGVATMRYELSDINGDLMIELPEGVGGFNLGRFLFSK